MEPGPGPIDHPELNDEAGRIWERNARWWDDHVGEGNKFQLLLIGPATERLLEIQPGESVLDLACGNGHFARRLARLGAEVMACDASEVFLECALARTEGHPGRIEYRQVDLTDACHLLDLGAGRFDAAVCGMALMDLSAVTPLFRALARLLKPGGRFVFSILHPCFNTTACTPMAEEIEEGNTTVTRCAIKVSGYLNLPPRLGIGIRGQPSPHYYFHRPLSALFSTGFQEGFVLDGLEEPAFGPDVEAAHPLNWANFKDIPPILVARMRSVGSRQ
jgi:2-polyprenyl-3-methyl-5-hydroxy-6-metoxy-1,4-benzoquinol methylase